MKIGFSIPQYARLASDAGQTARFARELEAAGADSLWVGDRLFAAVDPRIGYGGMMDTIPAEFNSVLDPFTLLGVVAGATERVQLGTHVLVATWYPPVVLARALTTIDVVSNGRLLPGLGVGWSPEEYEAVGLEFRQRGKRLDETLDALEAIWTTDPAEYRGTLVTVPRHHSNLKPIQRPRPPIYLASFSEAALQRVGRRGDGWLPILMPGQVDLDGLRAQQTIVEKAAAEAGRDPKAIDAIVRVNVARGDAPQVVVDDIKRVFETLGFTHFFIEQMYTDDTVDQAIASATGFLDLIGTR
jgi:probable F420-dependent oxidoreductase